MKNLLTVVLAVALCSPAGLMGAEPASKGKPVESPKITLQSRDGKNFEIAQDKAEKSITLKNMLEDIKGPDLNANPIPFPTIDGNTLEAVVNCLQDPEMTEVVISSLVGDTLYKFNTAISYLDIPEIFEKLPAIHWLRKKSDQAISVLSGHKWSVFAVAISPDGKFIVTGSGDRTARIWNIKGEQIAELRGHAGTVSAVAISPDGKFIVTGSEDNTARIWNSEAGEQIAVLQGHEGSVNAVAISPDGKFIVTGSEDNTARIWNIKGEQLAVLQGHEDSVSAVAISLDGKFIVTGSDDNTARIWSSETGKEIAKLRGHANFVNAVAISPDGKFIVTGSLDKAARIWNIKGEQIAELQGHEYSVNAVAISFDGKFIVTGSSDKTVRIWNIKGEQIAELRGHENSVRAVAISPDGKFIVTGSWDHTARIWYLFDKEQVRSLHANQINLITKIYEQVQKDGKLDLVQKKADTLKLRAQKKVDEILFDALPVGIQAVLEGFVILPKAKK